MDVSTEIATVTFMIMTLAEQTTEIARAQDGVTEHPPGSNRGEMVDRYLRAVGVDPTQGAYAWCAALVSWCVIEAEKIVGGPALFRGSAGALHLLELNAQLRIDEPIPNCVGVMDHGKGKGHAFFILSIDGETLHTFEGNSDAAGSRTGGRALLRTRRRDEVDGLIRIG